MGLDQFSISRKDGNEQELMTWRKHNRLQGWMENLWQEKRKIEEENKDDGDRFIDALDYQEEVVDFNCQEVELTLEDIEELEKVIEKRDLPETTGFFLGNDSYEDYEESGYKDKDLKFIEKAREAINNGMTVVYSSWY